jgi:2-polyprenyl-3-methyl-5-hydroxy-6-metoxy-1,4-benzoquinol methylase
MPLEAASRKVHNMDRSAWINEKRHVNEQHYDSIIDYDEHWGHINPSHAQFLEKFLSLCPPGCTILDAACGTGKYWPMILASGRSVFGIDQSQGMLDRAQAKYPDVPVEKIGLQEITYKETFDGLICMDAMEFVFPEDWRPILRNFHRALKSNGLLYFTVEVIDANELQQSLAEARKQGQPVIEGEYAHHGGYHYYPAIDQVRQWVQNEGFTIVKDAEGDGYHHFLMRKM